MSWPSSTPEPNNNNNDTPFSFYPPQNRNQEGASSSTDVNETTAAPQANDIFQQGRRAQAAAAAAESRTTTGAGFTLSRRPPQNRNRVQEGASSDVNESTVETRAAPQANDIPRRDERERVRVTAPEESESVRRNPLEQLMNSTPPEIREAMQWEANRSAGDNNTSPTNNNNNNTTNGISANNSSGESNPFYSNPIPSADSILAAAQRNNAALTHYNRQNSGSGGGSGEPRNSDDVLRQQRNRQRDDAFLTRLRQTANSSNNINLTRNNNDLVRQVQQQQEQIRANNRIISSLRVPNGGGGGGASSSALASAAASGVSNTTTSSTNNNLFHSVPRRPTQEPQPLSIFNQSRPFTVEPANINNVGRNTPDSAALALMPSLSTRSDSSSSDDSSVSMPALTTRGRAGLVPRDTEVAAAAAAEATRAAEVAAATRGNNNIPTEIGTSSATPAARRSNTTTTTTTNGPARDDRMPGLRRIMNRIMFQTMASRGLLPPGMASEEDMMDENGEPRDTMELFGMFEDAFDVNPPTDVRKPDQLVCPTCMRVHLPVEGSESIALPKEEEEEVNIDGVEGDAEDDSDQSSMPSLEDSAGAANETLSPLINPGQSRRADNSNSTVPGGQRVAPTEEEVEAMQREGEAMQRETSQMIREMIRTAEQEQERIAREAREALEEDDDNFTISTYDGDPNDLADFSVPTDTSDDDTMSSLESVVPANAASVNANTNDNEVAESGDSANQNEDDDNEEEEVLSVHTHVDELHDDDGMPPLEDVSGTGINIGNANEEHETSSQATHEVPDPNIAVAAESNGDDNSEESSLPPLIVPDEDDDDSSMPPLIQRDLSSSGSESSSSMPMLIRSSFAQNQTAGRNPSGGGGGLDGLGGLGGLGDGFALSSMFTGGGTTNRRSRNTTDMKHTNPITHLRDYGALRVYAHATCPVCLDEHEPIVALSCGHAICEEDYKRLGGYLASDKDKIKKELGASDTVELVACPVAPPPSGTTRRPVRGTGYVHSLTMNCQNPNCHIQPHGIHRSLFSIDDEEHGGLKYLKCYPLPTKVIPDGHGGLWIHEGKRMGDTINWPLWHRSKHGRETERFAVPRNCDLEPDGNGGVWAISRPEQELNNDHISEITRYLVGHDGNEIVQHVAYTPQGSDTYFAGGRGGKCWIYVCADDDYDFTEEQKDKMLDDGLWIVGANTIERIDDVHEGVGFATGDVDPDGCGGLWLLEESDDLDDIVLKHYNHHGVKEETPFHFPIGSTEVYACDRPDSVFVYLQPPGSEDHEGMLTYICKDPDSRQWVRNTVRSEVPTDTKFVSTGDGELWALMMDIHNQIAFWKCSGTEMKRYPYEWTLTYSAAELIEG